MDKKIAVLWKEKNVSGRLELVNRGEILEVNGQAGRADYSIDTGRLTAGIGGAMLDKGSFATIVTVRGPHDFSFFLRDVRKDRPVWIPEYEAAVTEADDPRDYEAVVRDIRAKGLKSKIGQMESQPEESFETAAAHNRNMPCDTWLGLSRDVRIFKIRPNTLSDPGCSMDTVYPMRHSTPVRFPELGDRNVEFNYFAGRGVGCRKDVTRRLEDGVLPILHMDSRDDEILYRQTMFVTLEKAPLKAENVRGTHYLAADMCAISPTERTEAQKALLPRIVEAEKSAEEETVLYLRIEAENISTAEKYAYFRIPQPNVHFIAEFSNFDMSLKDGLDTFNESGRVFLTASVDGQPVRDVEYAILLAPGEKTVFEFKIPHEPLSRARAEALYRTDFDEKLAECRAYFRAKLAKTAKISLPEKRIEEMMKAGFLHLDLICYGEEPDGPVAPTVGVYTPIGTESTPIIQYIESMGDSVLAGRAARYFAEKQRPDGFMQNFSNYMSETGLGLWSLAQHYRYTGDKDYLRSVADNLVRGCDYIIKWSDEIREEKYRKHGYGMISGKVADCAYPFHSYMLNSTTYGGVKNCGEVLREIGDPNAERILAFAEKYKKDILETLAESFAVAPVIPLADGSWCPAVPQWPEIHGPMCLFADGGKTFSHGMMVECSENGCYDILYGILEPDSVFAGFIVKAVTELNALENTVFSQAYYSVHPYAHLRRGETGSFLKEFYNNMSAMADRETYSFWEHQSQISSHKTHEESWFLMRCRWMLFLEEGNTLSLLKGVPRRWLADGQEIAFDGMNSLFGRLSVRAVSDLSRGEIRAEIRLTERGTGPEAVRIRLPHPEGKKAVLVTGGTYDAGTETVTVRMDNGSAQVTLRF